MRLAIRFSWHQALRLLSRPQWGVFALASILVALLAASEVEAAASNSGLRISALDVHAAATNNLMLLGYLLLTSLAFVVGDCLATDLEGGFARLAVSRGLHVAAWWSGQLVALACATCAASVLLLAVCAGTGGLRGMPVGSSPSALAVAPVVERGTELSPPVATDTSMWLRQLAITGYVAFGWFSLLAAAVAATCWYPRRVLPVTLVLLGLMADFLAVKVYEPWRAASLGLRLLEGAHAPTTMAPLSLGVSLSLYAALAGGSFAVGLIGLRRRDL